jgi:hypothetical protein
MPAHLWPACPGHCRHSTLCWTPPPSSSCRVAPRHTGHPFLLHVAPPSRTPLFQPMCRHRAPPPLRLSAASIVVLAVVSFGAGHLPPSIYPSAPSVVPSPPSSTALFRVGDASIPKLCSSRALRSSGTHRPSRYRVCMSRLRRSCRNSDAPPFLSWRSTATVATPWCHDCPTKKKEETVFRFCTCPSSNFENSYP